jgi:vancomycin resistance protein VanJ
MALSGDRWWFATVMLFAPRWIYALPLVVLAPLTLLARRWALLRVLAAAIFVIVVPIMGFCLSPGSFSESDEPTIRILTCNICGEAGDRAKLKSLLDAEDPDLFVIQECPKTLDDAFFQPWHVRRSGQLLVGSRHPIRDMSMRTLQTEKNPWPRVDAICVTVETPEGELQFCGLHLISPRPGLSVVLSRKTGVSRERRAELEEELAARRHQSLSLADWLQEPGEAAAPSATLVTSP